MMVKSILLDQNAKEWEFNVRPPVQILTAKIDEKTQNIKLYYFEEEQEIFRERTVKIFDCGTNQPIDEKHSIWSSIYICSLSQHEGNIVHHLFYDIE